MSKAGKPEIVWLEKDPQRFEHYIHSSNVRMKGCSLEKCDCFRFGIKPDDYGYTLLIFEIVKEPALFGNLIDLLKKRVPGVDVEVVQLYKEKCGNFDMFIVCKNAPMAHCKEVAQKLFEEQGI